MTFFEFSTVKDLALGLLGQATIQIFLTVFIACPMLIIAGVVEGIAEEFFGL